MDIYFHFRFWSTDGFRWIDDDGEYPTIKSALDFFGLEDELDLQTLEQEYCSKYWIVRVTNWEDAAGEIIETTKYQIPKERVISIFLSEEEEYVEPEKPTKVNWNKEGF